MQTIDRRHFNTGLFLGFGLAGCAQLTSGPPDLVVTAIRWSEDAGATWHTGPIKAGSNVWFEADVTNQGGGPTPDGVIIGVAFRINGVMAAWSDAHTTALPAGQTITLRANGGPDGDKYWNNAPVGTHTVRAHVDDIDRIPNELDETDNTLDVLLTVQSAGGASPAIAWTGINANTGFYMASSYQTAANTELVALNAGAVRMGMDGVGGSSVGAPFNWTARDAVVAAHLAAGLKIHAGFGAEFQVSKGNNETEWKNNFRYFASNVFLHYNDRIMYYILGNEPDLAGRYSYDKMVEFMQIAKEARDAINPSIVLESDPVASPSTAYLRNAINGGLTQYVDVVGIHAYGGYISESAAYLGKPCAWMKAANTASGYPIVPVANSECGFNIEWPRPSNWTAREAQAHWFAQNRVQCKRFGYLNTLQYSINSTVSGNLFDIADIGISSPYSVTRFQPTHDTVAKVNIDGGLRNAGFESPNDIDTDWVVFWNPDGPQSSGPPEWNRVSFLTDRSQARTGAGYMRMTCGATNRVRQVVEGLTPGQEYILTAHAKLSASGPTAMLKALGFNHHDGQQESAQGTTVSGTYQQLQVTFTPSITWVVVSLESSGGATSQFIYWDDVSIDAALV